MPAVVWVTEGAAPHGLIIQRIRRDPLDLSRSTQSTRLRIWRLGFALTVALAERLALRADWIRVVASG